MKAEINNENKAKYLQASCGVRYWEDSTVNGIEDEKGTLIPCRDGDYWKPIIEIDSGIIMNWKQGVVADIHYKVCDDGKYYLLDSNMKQIAYSEGYVIKMMCPYDNGYGDYVIMKVDENGKIEGFNSNFKEFEF